ncbi:hypothetical protein [Bacillus thuringiensis]
MIDFRCSNYHRVLYTIAVSFLAVIIGATEVAFFRVTVISISVTLFWNV